MDIQTGATLKDRVDKLQRQVEQLQDQLQAEREDREHALQRERQHTQEVLQQEAKRLLGAIDGVRGDLRRLEELTTGDVRLRRDGIVLLLFGIILTTWPAWWADHALGWLSWPLFVGLVEYYIAWRLCRSIFAAIRAG